jgi:putative ABC transport system ATP-binding protein
MTNWLIQTHRLSKTYGHGKIAVNALNGVNIEIERGEFVAIMGPSGSGKSTLMNILGCLDRPTTGAYWLDGKDVSQLNKDELAAVRNHKIGFVFQSFNLLPRATALQNVIMPMLYGKRKYTPRECEEKAIAALAAVNLADRANHQPNELSGGERQRVAIARALVSDPPLILADEPTGNLDSHSSEEIMAILQNLHRRHHTIVMVTHEPSLAAHTERIISVHDGHVRNGHVRNDEGIRHRKRVINGKVYPDQQKEAQ